LLNLENNRDEANSPLVCDTAGPVYKYQFLLDLIARYERELDKGQQRDANNVSGTANAEDDLAGQVIFFRVAKQIVI